MTFQEIEEFIKNNPTRANELSKAASQASPSDPITPEVELGREILTILPYLTQTQNEPEKEVLRHSQAPGIVGATAILPFSLRKDKTEIMENDRKYNMLKQQKLKGYKKEWEKNNPGKNFYKSKESIDFIHGSLDDKSVPSLKEQTEKAFREHYAKKAQKYDKKALNTKRNPNRDIAISYSGFEIEREIALRKALFARENPTIQTKDLKTEGKRIEERVRQKRWEEFVKKYPQKAKAYEKSHKEISAAVSRINAPKITGDESLDDKLREYYNQKWEKREAPKEEKKEIQGFGEVPRIGDEKLDDELRSFYNKTSSQKPVREPVQKQPSVSPTSSRFQKPAFETVRAPRFKNLRLPGRGGNIDRINRLVHRGRRMKQGTKMAKQAAKKIAKKALAQAGRMLLSNPYVLAIVIGIILLILIIFGLFFFFSGGQNPSSINPTPTPTPILTGPPIPGLELHKSGPNNVRNNELIRYDINVTYAGNLDVTIIDPIPLFSIFDSATDGYTLEHEGESRQVSAVKWRLKDNVDPNSTDPTKFLFNLWVEPYDPNLSPQFSVTNQAFAIAEEPTPPPGGGGGSGNACTKPYEGTGYCSYENLKNYFNDGQKALIASMMCQAESSSNPDNIFINCGWSLDYSIGLYQIDLYYHCPQAQPYWSGTYPNYYNCGFRDIAERDNCTVTYKNPDNNIQKMLALSKYGTSWSPWAYSWQNKVQPILKKCGII